MGLEEPDEGTQQRTTQRPRQHDERYLDGGGEITGDAHDGGDDGAQYVLALRPNVEQARLECKRHRHSGEQYGGCLEDDVGNVLRLAKGTIDQRGKRLEGVIARNGNDYRGKRKADEHGNQDVCKRLPQEANNAAHWTSPPAMSSPSCSSSTVPCGYSPTICP